MQVAISIPSWLPPWSPGPPESYPNGRHLKQARWFFDVFGSTAGWANVNRVLRADYLRTRPFYGPQPPQPDPACLVSPPATFARDDRQYLEGIRPLCADPGHRENCALWREITLISRHSGRHATFGIPLWSGGIDHLAGEEHETRVDVADEVEERPIGPNRKLRFGGS